MIYNTKNSLNAIINDDCHLLAKCWNTNKNAVHFSAFI